MLLGGFNPLEWASLLCSFYADIEHKALVYSIKNDGLTVVNAIIIVGLSPDKTPQKEYNLT
jgi:hypothetical protein